MDKKCQNVAAFDLDFCLMLCTDNVATDNETIPLCVSLVWQSPQTSYVPTHLDVHVL